MLLTHVKLLFYIGISFWWALTMADMSSLCQELSVTVKVYDFFPYFPNLLWLWCFFGFVLPHVLWKPFFKCDQLACFAAYWAERIFTAES